MKIIVSKLHRLDRLADEIVAVFPFWRGTQLPDGSFVNPLFSIMGDGNIVRLTVPDDADITALDAVINSHDSTQDSIGDAKIKFTRQAKTDLLANKLPKPSDIDGIVEAVFNNATAGQRTYLKRLSKLVLYLARAGGLQED